VDLLRLYNLPHYPLGMIVSLPIVFDVVDEYLMMLDNEVPFPQPGPIRSLERWAFARLLRRCDLVTVIPNELRD
jgi:hypothetical protein